MAEVDGNRTRLTRIARDNRFEGGGALAHFPWSEAKKWGLPRLVFRFCSGRLACDAVSPHIPGLSKGSSFCRTRYALRCRPVLG
jgi:hypothetical protein